MVPCSSSHRPHCGWICSVVSIQGAENSGEGEEAGSTTVLSTVVDPASSPSPVFVKHVVSYLFYLGCDWNETLCEHTWIVGTRLHVVAKSCCQILLHWKDGSSLGKEYFTL